MVLRISLCEMLLWILFLLIVNGRIKCIFFVRIFLLCSICGKYVCVDILCGLLIGNLVCLSRVIICCVLVELNCLRCFDVCVVIIIFVVIVLLCN